MAEFLHQVVKEREAVARRRVQLMPTYNWVIDDWATAPITPYTTGSHLYMTPRTYLDANGINQRAFQEFHQATQNWGSTCTDNNNHIFVLSRCDYEHGAGIAVHSFRCRTCQGNMMWRVLA